MQHIQKCDRTLCTKDVHIESKISNISKFRENKDLIVYCIESRYRNYVSKIVSKLETFLTIFRKIFDINIR